MSDPSPYLYGTNVLIAWDSVCIGALKTCPRYFQLSILEGWQPKRKSVHLAFGAHLHKAVERFESYRLEGTDREEALEKCVSLLLEESKGMAEKNTKTRFTLAAAIVDYADFYEKDRMRTMRLSDGTPATELSFQIPLELDYKKAVLERITFCGHLDRVSLFEGTPYVVDVKTTVQSLSEAGTSKFFDGYNPDSQ